MALTKPRTPTRARDPKMSTHRQWKLITGKLITMEEFPNWVLTGLAAQCQADPTRLAELTKAEASDVFYQLCATISQARGW